MNSSVSSSLGASPAPEDKLRHLPAEARAAYDRFQAAGDFEALDVVIFAILEDYVPTKPSAPIADLPAETRMIADLGFDSLAITEVVFFTEDLFGITISNEEIVRVETVGGLREFVRQKVRTRTAAA